MSLKRSASVPASGDPGRQGGQASPPNPTKISSVDGEKLTEKLDLRCTVNEKNLLKQQAKAAGVSQSQLLREGLGLVEVRRRKPTPAVPPELIRTVSQAARELRGLARHVEASGAANLNGRLDRVALLAAIVSVDRRLSEFITRDAGPDQC